MEVLNTRREQREKPGRLAGRGAGGPRAGRPGGPRGPQYIYGIVGSKSGTVIPTVPGLEGRPVHLVSSGPLAAVTSDYPSHELVMALRRNLAPHHLVLTELMRSQAILPMRFGHVAASPGEVSQFIEVHRERFLELLHRIEDCVEMGLRVSLVNVSPFQRIVSLHEDLSMLRDELFRDGRKPNREEAMRLGRLFESCLSRERTRHEEQILGKLRGAFKDVSTKPPRTEAVLLDAALLVPRRQREALESRLEELTSKFGPEYLFEFSGPFPPFSFSTVDGET